VVARAAPRPELPLSEVTDEEVDENVKPHANVQVAPAEAKPPIAKRTEPKSPLNVTAIEEEIVVDISTNRGKPPVQQNDSKDEIEEEVDYDDDFEAASDGEKEYQPTIRTSISKAPSPEPDKPRMVSIRPDTAGGASVRTGSPGIISAREPPPAQASREAVREAMEKEKRKAQMSSNIGPPKQDTVSSGNKGFMADYSSTMPKFNLGEGSRPSEKAALQRLRELKKLQLFDRRSTEKLDIFSQRPQTEHSLFLAHKSLKYCNVKTVSCQTGEDDMETGTMTDDIWTDEKEVQFPTLNMGQSSKAENESSQMLPFLRRTLPLFEASIAETQHRQLPAAGQPDMAQGTSDAQRVKRNSTFGLPDAFVHRCIDANVSIADLCVCPEWYGADHTAVIYTWPWKKRPPPDAGNLLDVFTRPVQSLIALYPIIGGSDGNILRPARCLYSFCRLSSLVVVGSRSHIVIAGSEVGCLLAWDLREKPSPPSDHASNRGSDSSARTTEADADLEYMTGPIWLGSAFSTDAMTFSSVQDFASPDADEDDPAKSKEQPKALAKGVHDFEICSVRCSEGGGSDPLIFALDLMGTVSFWRVLEFASNRGTQIKLALQGSISLPSSSHSLCGFVDARGLCIHPQQQMQFVVVATSGVHQSHRHQRVASVSDGPGTFELTGHLDEDYVGTIGATTQPTSAAFNPFFPGLLLVAYSEGDLALFDCTMCVAATHWSGAIAKSPNLYASVAWSPCRPCVFFVKSLDALDVWDLAEKAYAPVHTVDLASHLGAVAGPGVPESYGTAVSSELYVTAKGHPVVAHNGKVVVLNLPASYTTPLQRAPPRYDKDEQAIDTLVVSGYEELSVFPTLEKHSRKVDVPQPFHVERDVMRRIVAGIHPLQAWT
jgi:hypothetical protein